MSARRVGPGKAANTDADGNVYRQCASNSKRTGQRCKNSALPGKKTCAFHGGKTEFGSANPNYRHGRYAEHVPTKLLANYQQSLEDPDILNMTAEVALIEAMLKEALERMDGEMSVPLWNIAEEHLDAFLAALAKQDRGEMQTTLNALQRTIARGQGEAAGRAEVRQLIADKGRTVERERKRRLEMETLITAEQALLVVGAISDIVFGVVRDPVMVRQISAGIDSVIRGNHHSHPV